MNAHALLSSQGWLGPGHALDSRLTDYGAPTYKQKGHRGLAYDPTDTPLSQTTTGNGLVKPLLVSQRHGSRYGIGKKSHEPQSGNQWWLKGFQSALDNIGKSESERSVTNSGTSTPRNGYVGKHSGLYGYFVQGQMMKGTLQEWTEQRERASKKRKSDVLEEDEHDSKKDPLAVSRVKRSQTVQELENSIPYLTERDKERKKAHRRAESTDVNQFTMVGEFLDCTKNEKKKQKTKFMETSGNATADDTDAVAETKEERRAGRKRRKEAKEKGTLTLAQMVEEELAKLSSINNSEDDRHYSVTDQTAKAARKKKRQKEQGATSA